MANATTKKKKTKTKTKKLKASSNPTYLKIKRENERFMGAVKEITTQFREFSVAGDNETRELRVYFPSPDIESSVNQTYAKTYGRLLQDDDCLPEAQILDLMAKRGVWGEDKDKRISSLQEKMAHLRNIIYLQGEQGMTVGEMDEVSKDYEEADKELQKLIATRSSFTANSIETRAYETKVKDQVWQCVKRVVDGKEQSLWADLDDIGGETDRVLLYYVINECVSFWQGVPSDFLDDSPETPDGEKDTPSLKQQDAPSSESPSSSGLQSDSTS